MIRVCLFCVTYHSYDYARRFLQSVDEAAARVSDSMEVSVCMGDNSDSDFQTIEADDYHHIDLRFFPYHENLGYLGCVFRMMGEMDQACLAACDYWSISNVDMTLDNDFFECLVSAHLSHFHQDNYAHYGWIAPDIFTPRHNEHDNPFMLSRPTKRSFLKWRLMYANVTFYNLLERVYYRRRAKRSVPTSPVEIYAGHGSFMLFTGQFLRKQKDFSFPAFMYSEEIFFAELLRRHGLGTLYYPLLKISNIGRVSTGGHGTEWMCRQCRQSLRAIEKMFFNS